MPAEIKAPEVLVTVDGNDVETAWGGMISRIQVDLDMDDEGSAVIDLEKVYELSSHSLSGAVSKGARPGSKVVVKMGYAGAKGNVFAGYLEQVELVSDSESAFIFRLHACDVVHLMKENSHCRILTQKQHSAVFTQLLGEYAWTGTGAASDATDAYDEARNWHQNGTDYDFLIKELIEQCPYDREFYVSDGTAYYKTPDSSQTVLAITPEEDAATLSAVSRYLHRKIQVYGASAVCQSFTGSSTAKAAFLSSSAGAGAEDIVIPDLDSQKTATAVAAGRAKRLERQSIRLTMELMGNNQLLAGAYVAVQKLDSIWNGTYRIRQAQHRYDEHGYQTKIVLEGC